MIDVFIVFGDPAMHSSGRTGPALKEEGDPTFREEEKESSRLDLNCHCMIQDRTIQKQLECPFLNRAIYRNRERRVLQIHVK